MKNIFFIITLLLPLISFAENPTSKEELVWYSFEEGMKKAQETKKKILVDVYTDWCSWCKKMDANTYSDKKVREYLEKNFIFIKLNAEGKNSITFKEKSIMPAQFAQAMGVSGYPATVFLQSTGEQITLLPGYVEAPMFLHILTFLAEEHYKTQNFDEYMKEKEGTK